MNARRGRHRSRGAERVARWRHRAATLLAIVTVAWPAMARGACTPSPLPRDTPTALVLSGGGAKGAYEAGVAAAFLRRGVPIT
ncbi:MAG TPA: hypothetical protein VMS64_03170, partial [Candidatus Methylomirabilis sp.]|nr:hypothetical protein [Candidatus Methylomirabilis sp.]